uniref:Uncharacterized protein n=1 Tax=Kalanchoe fedtschenkoi TaxID=63787 RepID=A0A7N0UJ26_KALFE
MCLSAAAIPSADHVPEVETSLTDSSLDAGTNSTEEYDNYSVNLKQLYDYLDTIENIASPGCSAEVLNVALESMSQIVISLSLVVPRHTSI